jgi:hypothetical protein
MTHFGFFQPRVRVKIQITIVVIFFISEGKIYRGCGHRRRSTFNLGEAKKIEMMARA